MYDIEVKIASKNGWMTPAESRAYYGKYSRGIVTVHWWGGGEGANMHDAIVNYLLGSASRGASSSNYIVSDNKITMSVHPDNVAYASTSGNPVSISIEFQPTLSAEGYKKGGWLIRELEKRYGVDMQVLPHNYWNSTQCPGTISLDRLVQEANKWATGQYEPAPVTPTPTPSPTPVNLTFSTITPSTYVANKPTTNLFQINKDTWAEIGIVKSFPKGEKIDIYGVVKNSKLNTEWYVTKYGYDNKLPNGFSKADLDLYVAPVPVPAPEVLPVVTEITPTKKMYTLANAKLLNIKDMGIVKTFPLDTPIDVRAKATYAGKEYYLTEYGFTNKTNQGFLIGDLKDKETLPIPQPPSEVPEWRRNLQDQDDTKYWLKEDHKLIDITTGKPAVTNGMETTFEKDDEFVSSARTKVGTTEYRITDYSFKKGIMHGLPIDKLTLTAPGVPNIDPIPTPTDPVVSANVVIAFLQTIQAAIAAFIATLGKK